MTERLGGLLCSPISLSFREVFPNLLVKGLLYGEKYGILIL